MGTLQDIIDNEAGEATDIATLAGLVQSLLDAQATLQKQIADLMSGLALPPGVQAQVDAALAASKANTDSVKATIAKIAPPETPA